MRAEVGPAPWLTITGTNGKTTTVEMLASMLRAAGLRATAAGNVGTPILEAVLHPEPYDVIAVELSSFQLHWSDSIAPYSSACLNVAPDHLDWHGSLEDYQRAKGKVYARTKVACVYNVQDPVTEQLVRDAEVQDGCRAIGFTLGTPALSMVGVVDDILADRAFVEQRKTSAAELATLDDVRGSAATLAPHNLANALAAAALARSYGVAPLAVRDGLRDFTPDPHRIADCGEVDGVRYVDDSKATNPHAAAASLARVRARGLDRREACSRGPTSTTSCATPSGSCGAWSSSGPIAPGSPRRWPDTHRMSRSSRCRARTLGSWRPSSRVPRSSPSRATSCCSRPQRPRWTCSPTTVPGATRSLRRSHAAPGPAGD